MTKRECEVCHYPWNCSVSFDWIVLCPKCKISGYHQRIKTSMQIIFPPDHPMAKFDGFDASIESFSVENKIRQEYCADDIGPSTAVIERTSFAQEIKVSKQLIEHKEELSQFLKLVIQRADELAKKRNGIPAMGPTGRISGFELMESEVAGMPGYELWKFHAKYDLCQSMTPAE